ncbi:hypothetical protein AV521_37875 [Streptomyces sp. IMTB 2501]|nr:hypothetical protein AV521_37875 [Streptomyces sp. IMTB 2501]
MDQLRLHISQNLTRPLTVADLATCASIGERHLNRLFRGEPGTTPGVYVESVRLEAARSRLESTDDTLDRIAVVCRARGSARSCSAPAGDRALGVVGRAVRCLLGAEEQQGREQVCGGDPRIHTAVASSPAVLRRCAADAPGPGAGRSALIGRWSWRCPMTRGACRAGL